MIIYTVIDKHDGEVRYYTDIHSAWHFIQKKRRIDGAPIFCNSAVVELARIQSYEKKYGSKKAKMILSKVSKFISSKETVNTYVCILMYIGDTGLEHYDIREYSEINMLALIQYFLKISDLSIEIAMEEKDYDD